MKKSIKDIESFISQHNLMTDQAKELVKELLKEFPNQSIEWDWKNDYAPSISSYEFLQDGDVTDCYISRLYVENDNIYADLHAYYENDDAEKINLKYESGVDYFELLDFIKNSLGETPNGGEKVSKNEHLMVQTCFGEVMLKVNEDNSNYIDVFSGDNYDNYLGMFAGSLSGDVKELSEKAQSVFNN